jgi:hypothetical protein
MTMTARSLRTETDAPHAQGVHGAGSRNYQPSQATRVLMILKNECAGPTNCTTLEALAARTGMNGRALREIIGDLEKAHQVLTDFTDGYYVCETPEQAERATRRLESQVLRMQERIAARRHMATLLDRKPVQGRLL